MNFDHSEEQRLLQESAARFVREQCDFAARQQVVASGSGYSTTHWALFAELGWLALPLAPSCRLPTSPWPQRCRDCGPTR